jgi:mono/diheme cytochrome c family protein/glucose/arabinose dehydrogenase
VAISTFSTRRSVIVRSGRRPKRYRNAPLVAVENARSPSRIYLVLFAIVALAVVPVLCLVAKGHGVKAWLIDHSALAPVHNAIASGLADPAIHFEKVALPITAHTRFTCVEMGPDHHLYAGTDDGRIFRYVIAANGTLESQQIITSLQDTQGASRLLTGFCFDPSSTANHLVMWASHGFYSFHDSPDFSGKISRLSGKNLELVQDVIVGLPRSVRDHLNNQPAFGPDGALYIPQGSNTASGAPDTEWGLRTEHRLNASILRLDISRVTPGQPIDVRTIDGGGEYDPSRLGAPLTIYASGIRNAFDMVWASDGHLYVPVNGSSIGGNTPAGPGVPTIQSLSQTEDDWLLRITPGSYYGHPNPEQGHFVLNGGNPGNKHDTSVITDYPVGILPDPRWQRPILDFGPHVSSDGIIEYHGSAFGGRLDHKLIVCRFGVPSDLICIGMSGEGNVSSIQTGITGFTNLLNPLDLAEDLATGNLYVAEYGAEHISLLRPTADAPKQVAQVASLIGISTTGSGPMRDAEHGRQLFDTTCIACHGANGGGIPHTGANLRLSRWVAEKNDDELADFIRSGRQKSDPNSLLGMTMPAKGGNPNLDDAGLHDVVAYLRSLQDDAKRDRAAED